eukprot:gene1384-1748_t
MEEKRKPIYYDLPGKVEKFKEMGVGNSLKLEMPAVRGLLPPAKGIRVLELGCGLGRYLKELLDGGAEQVIGIDISKRMIEEARLLVNNDPKVQLINDRMETIDQHIPLNSMDLVISSYALIYVRDFKSMVEQIHKVLKPGGKFVFSTLHPIRTAGVDIGFVLDDKTGEIKYWGIKDYHNERLVYDGWLDKVDQEEYYHRTLDTIIDNLLSSGFRLDALKEPKPVDDHEMEIELQRPEVIVIATTKL